MNIPKPIKFNCIKHHLDFIKDLIFLYSDTNRSLEDLKSEMKTIGNSQMDIYTGSNSVEDIANEIMKLLKNKDILSYHKYINWIKEKKSGYTLITLDDKSIWTLRLGDEKERYVHIHPARNSVYSIRVKATTLKTAIIYAVETRRRNFEMESLILMNDLRKKYLNEPPLKSLKKSNAILKLVKLLEDKAGDV